MIRGLYWDVQEKNNYNSQQHQWQYNIRDKNLKKNGMERKKKSIGILSDKLATLHTKWNSHS